VSQYKKILVPLDGSEVAEAILPAVETCAKAFNSTITIVRAYYAHVFPGVDPVEAQANATREAEDYVHSVEERLKAKGVSVNSHTTFEADAAKAILDYCARYDVDLVMMSTHGHGAIGHWLLGSVAEKVVHHAITPIFLVRAIK
jgi:nucleotide-binding universal stress UspA family protein